MANKWWMSLLLELSEKYKVQSKESSDFYAGVVHGIVESIRCLEENNVSTTLNKDKIILAYYVDVQAMHRSRVAEYIREIMNYLDSTNSDDTIMYLVVPCNETKIEWVNRLDVDDEKMKLFKDYQTHLIEKLDKFLEENK